MLKDEYENLGEYTEKAKSEFGKNVEGYVCVDVDEEIGNLIDKPIYITPIDSLTQLCGQDAVVYKVTGTSVVDEVNWNECRDRAYYMCRKVIIQGPVTKDELFKRALQSLDKPNDILRLISFYPITKSEAVTFAKTVINYPGIVKAICDKFANCDPCSELVELNKILEESNRLQKERKENTHQNVRRPVYKSSKSNN